MDASAFYDSRAEKTVRDFVRGNDRLERQRDLLRRWIAGDARRVLVIGCGGADTCLFIARRVARRAEVLGVDLSPACIEVAGRLFSHPRVSYETRDVLAAPATGEPWDAIVLPDSYEHFTAASRPGLHRRLAQLLAPHGTLLVTVPTVAHQDMLRRRGEGLQPVDEDVSLEDLARLASDVGGLVTYFEMLSIWRAHDYAHAVIERGAGVAQPLPEPRRGPVGRVWRSLAWRIGAALRRRHVARRLEDDAGGSAAPGE